MEKRNPTTWIAILIVVVILILMAASCKDRGLQSQEEAKYRAKLDSLEVLYEQHRRRTDSVVVAVEAMQQAYDADINRLDYSLDAIRKSRAAAKDKVGQYTDQEIKDWIEKY